MKVLECLVKGENGEEDWQESLRHVFEEEVSPSEYKRCLTVVLELLEMHVDGTFVTYILEHLSALDAMLFKYPLFQKQYVKMLVTLAFSSTDPELRLKATVALITFSKRFVKQVADILKQAYQAFSKACHSISIHNLPMLSLATNSLVELFATHPRTSHAYSLVLLRMLASQLYKALKHPSASTIQDLQSWKWIAPVRFFARYLTNNKDTMQEPFIQMICAALNVKVSMNTLPFHFHLLTCISDSPHMIPNAFGALLQIGNILSQANSKQEHGKPRTFYLPSLITVSDADISTRSYHDAAVDEAFYLILKYLVAMSAEASFPEISDNVIGCLRSMQTKNPRIKQHIFVIAEKCESVCMEVKNARFDYTPLNHSSMSIKKENKLTLFLHEIEEKRAMRTRMALTGVVEREKRVKQGRKQEAKKSKKRRRKEPRNVPSDEDQGEGEDVLEDLALSDLE